MGVAHTRITARVGDTNRQIVDVDKSGIETLQLGQQHSHEGSKPPITENSVCLF